MLREYLTKIYPNYSPFVILKGEIMSLTVKLFDQFQSRYSDATGADADYLPADNARNNASTVERQQLRDNLVPARPKATYSA